MQISTSIGIPGDGAIRAGEFLPTQLSGCVLWVRADLGVTLNGSNVSQWNDLSGSGHNLAQGAAGSQPLFVASAQNGKPAVRFDGVDDFLGPAAFTLNQSCQYALVCKSITNGASGVNDIVACGNTTNGLMFSNNTPQFGINSGASLIFASAVANGAYAYVDGLFNGVSSSIRVGGSQVASGDAGATAPGGFTLGALGSGLRPTNIEVAEVIVYNRLLTAIEQARLDAYRKTRYAL